jgi:hypothetical protein
MRVDLYIELRVRSDQGRLREHLSTYIQDDPAICLFPLPRSHLVRICAFPNLVYRLLVVFLSRKLDILLGHFPVYHVDFRSIL